MGITTVTPDNWTNYGHGSLNTSITNVQTTLPLHTGEGAKFPTTYPYVVAINAQGTGPELCTVTGNSSDTLTVTRGVESTSGNQIAWGANISVDLIISAGQMAHIWSILSSLNTGALPNDGGLIATNGSGQTTWAISVTDGQAIIITNSSTNTNSPLIKTTVSAATGRVLDALVTGDTVDRFVLQGDGKMRWGAGGSSALDLNLYRSAAATLKTDNAFVTGTSLTVTTTISTDGATITSDGSGNLSVVSTHSGSYKAADGTAAITVANSTGNVTLAATLSVTGAISKVGNISTAGPYGVPIVAGVSTNTNVTVNTQQTILSFTTPNDGRDHALYIHAEPFVGGGNTNAGTLTLAISYTDPNAGALNLNFFVYGQTNAVSAFSEAKGTGLRTYARSIVASPNTVVSVLYTNSAAGTISDFVTAVIVMCT